MQLCINTTCAALGCEPGSRGRVAETFADCIIMLILMALGPNVTVRYRRGDSRRD